MDEEESMALELDLEQYQRWLKAGTPKGFFKTREEMRVVNEIDNLRALSNTYVE